MYLIIPAQTYMICNIDEVTEAQKSDRQAHSRPIHSCNKRLGKVDEGRDKLSATEEKRQTTGSIL